MERTVFSLFRGKLRAASLSLFAFALLLPAIGVFPGQAQKLQMQRLDDLISALHSDVAKLDGLPPGEMVGMLQNLIGRARNIQNRASLLNNFMRKWNPGFLNREQAMVLRGEATRCMQTHLKLVFSLHPLLHRHFQGGKGFRHERVLGLGVQAMPTGELDQVAVTVMQLMGDTETDMERMLEYQYQQRLRKLYEALAELLKIIQELRQTPVRNLRG